jgi:hypothetical protein
MSAAAAAAGGKSCGWCLVAPLAVALSSVIFCLWKQHRKKAHETATKEYTGSCHCKAVQFKCIAPEYLVVWNCNCSICNMRKNWHFIVPESQFELIEGGGEDNDAITLYQFRTATAKHLFCSKCGVQAFYRPRSNPDGVGITFACVPAEQIVSYEIRDFDGQNWEAFHSKSGIADFSKI